MEAFKSNLAELYRHYSTYVVFCISSLIAYFLQLTPDAQVALLELVPLLKTLAPATSFLVFILARGLPQKPKDE